jgi:adenylate kinase
VRLRVVVLGIPGVGKTTVVQNLVSMLRSPTLVNFGTVMFEEAKARKWVHDRDEMRKLPVRRQKTLQQKAAAKIARMKHPLVLVDTHLFIRTQEGFWPGLPFEVVRALKPTHLVLVEASTEEIFARRTADKLRFRDALTKDELAEEKALARSFLAVSSSLTGAPMMVVNNAEGKADEAASAVAKALGQA